MTALTGLRVWLTRPEPDVGRSAERWRDCGATVTAQPLLQIRALSLSAAEHREIGEFQATRAVLTSANAATHYAREFGSDAPIPVAAVGPRTAAHARQLGLRVDFVASTATAADLARELVAHDADQRFLLPGARRQRPELARILVDAGSEVRPVTLYETVERPLGAELRDSLGPADLDLIACYSPSAVEALVNWDRDGDLADVELAALGRTTATAVRRAGRRLAVYPSAPGEAALLEEVGRWWRTRR